MSNPLTPQSVNSRGVITATDADGNRHHFHTDEQEARQFAFAAKSLAAERDELFLLLYSDACPTYAAQRQADGRSDDQLKSDWLSKVTAAGMPEAAALKFLTARLEMQDGGKGWI